MRNSAIYSLAKFPIEIHSLLPLVTFDFERFRILHPAQKKKCIQLEFRLICSRDLVESPLELDLSTTGRRGISSKLLGSRQVMARLKEIQIHNQQMFIEMHPASMSIFDFIENRANFFFAAESPAKFKNRMLGPAMLAPFLPKFDSLLLHASAIVRHGRAAVFLAPDEGGKTTAVRLAPSGTILCDDQVILRRQRGRFRAWGTPWGLHLNAKANAPLAGLFLLQKSKHFTLKPFPAREMVPVVWEEIKNPLSILPKPLRKKAFNILCDVVASAPTWILSFPKDHIDWKAVDQALIRPK